MSSETKKASFVEKIEWFEGSREVQMISDDNLATEKVFF